MSGYIKLHRTIKHWEWYTDTNTKSLFLHCLLSANYEPKSWRGEVVEAGSFVTSLDHLARETGLSVRSIRTSLNHLKSTQEVTYKTTSKYTVITVVKWLDYQGIDDENDTVNDTVNDKQVTNKRQTNDKQTTTTKEYKNIRNKEIKNNTNTKEGSDAVATTPTKSSFGQFGQVKLTPDEHAKIIADHLEKYIDRVDAYKASTGKRYKSDYATILAWKRKDDEKAQQGNRVEPIPDYGTPTGTVDIDELKQRISRLKGAQ